MFRSPPPRGRVRRIVVVALLSALVTLPASAATPGDGLTVSTPVTGRDPLLIGGIDGAGEIAVTITDAHEAVARWLVDASEVDEDGTLAVDVWAPAEGDAPVNGQATVSVDLAGEAALTASVVLDLSPASPPLNAEVDGADVVVDWDAVAGPAGLTYRLERSSGKGWTRLYAGPSADPVRDLGVEQGVHRYRVTAAVPGAEGGVNRSAATIARVRITAAQPTPTPVATEVAQPPASEPPATPTPGPSEATTEPAVSVPALPPPLAHRDVAATGAVRGAVDGDWPGRTRRARRPRPEQSASTPAVPDAFGPGLRWRSAAMPPVAAQQDVPSAAAPRVAPVALPRRGVLTVEAGAAAQARPDVAAGAAALVLVLFGVAALFPRRVHAISRVATQRAPF